MAARRGPLGCWLSAAAGVGFVGLTVSVVLRSVGEEGPGDGGAPRAAASGPILPPVPDDFPPPPPDTVALLEGLQPGQKLGTLTVTGIRLMPEKRLVVRVAQSAGTGFSIIITTLAADPNEPPLKTERYKVFSGQGRDYDGRVDPAVATATVNLIVERLQRTEKTVPTPQGM